MALDAPLDVPLHEYTDTTGDDISHRLLSAAAELFAEKGYEQAGVAEIARRAGVTTGAIYSRYTGKAQLILDAVKHHMPDEINRLLRSTSDQRSPTVVLAELGEHLLDDLHEGTGLFLEAIVASRRDPELSERLQKQIDEEDQQLASLISAAKTAGLLDPELDDLAVVRFAHAIGFGMILTRTMGLNLPSPEAWTKLINRFISSLSPQSDHQD
ncbi:MAG: TetR/AcrR family transcriptional regulator [Actinobacteria bacterium]|jgi:AcrR family transcriptional regulator|nr:TetR/AcrR family transcriptional regulator [Actinomycetota bacterium]